MGRLGFVHQATICTWMFIIALASPTQATEPDYAATGPYLGVGAAFAWDNFDNIGRLDPDMAYGFNAWGGYRFLSYLAAELQIEYVNGFDDQAEIWIRDIFPSPLLLDRSDAEGEAVTFTGNLKAYLPLGRFQPFVLAGVGLGYVEFDLGRRKSSDTDFAARFGGGIDFYVTEALALQISSSYVLQTGDLNGFDYVSLIAGLQYRF
jgi:opacity protein-like surface antigen